MVLSGSVKLALLGLLAVATVETVRQAPAFNAAARVEGPSGRWSTDRLADLYEPGRYRQTQAEAFLAAAARAPSPSDASAAARRARDLALSSLALRPRNAYAWTTLALARRALGEDAAAIAALRRSASLAPHAFTLARIRLLAFADVWPRLGPEDRRRLLSDLALISEDDAALAAVLTNAPFLERRLGLARMTFPSGDGR